ncbi:uncharacterized protein PHACADRAFT_181874 [Phanerochaete carnosa HHB-10118-sp]|uniref:Uncharacterized protein n=1 Tax=Phanerochaete carnosa (strain HHB-10118-sp) TaxID=650164 RepID=K5WL92_PHACS|nr:uncharacterized protein PHACADRAFT_181874 [Phanerochaete carnosa HHB-10118-sp]EKM59939.1 hypothetical protein PHACADRAFT_181874 [Phanerochaete carnosa HHB-10118-sp]
MAASMESLSGANFVSSHSADVILSDVRPIKLKLEALRSLNVLLDELLYTILSIAGSLSTDKLKGGLSKLLPNSLGKTAVTEAEVELKAYWERNAPHTPNEENFDLQWSFELLRLKCEAYTTMNDLDEDEDAERKLSEKMLEAGNPHPPGVRLVSPAALYLTAILEHICEHILSDVSRVAARDSSRAVATVQDLFVALCEDASVYSMFRTMKVYDQIDALSKVQKPRRSKSLTKSMDRGSLSSRAASPQNESSSPPSSMRILGHRIRASSESAGSLAPAAYVGVGSSRSSKDSPGKARKKLFGRSSLDQDGPPEGAESLDDDSKRSNSIEMMDEEALREFDELMQTATTMKVSLTPDRLKSMEVYKHERRRPKTGESDSLSTTEAEVKRAVSVRRVQARLVDSITEDEEPVPLPIKVSPSPIQDPVITPRSREASLNHSTLSPSPLPTTRARSVTLSSPQLLREKPSRGRMHPPVPPPRSQPPGEVQGNWQNPASTQQSMSDGRPQWARKIGRNRESLDLNEVMGVDDEETEVPPRTPSSRRDPSRPYISKGARDLIDFLDEGPPIQMMPPNRNASMVSLESSKSRSGGRLQRMMSKLTLGSSSEKFNGRSSMTTESSRAYRSLNSSVTSYSPQSYLQSPTNTVRGPAVVVATPPPPTASLAKSLSSYMAQEPAVKPTPQAVSPTSSRRMSITRKPVPAWDETRDAFSAHSSSATQTSEQPSSSPRYSPNRKSSSSKRASPLDAFPPPPTTVNVNGVVHDSDSEIVRTASLASSNRCTPNRAEFPSPSSLHSSPNTPPSPSSSSKQQSVRHVPPIAAIDAGSRTSLAYDIPEVTQQSWPPTPLSIHREVPVLDAAAPINARVKCTGVIVSTSEKGVAAEALTEPTFTAEQARDLRRLLAVATTADECRLLADMFLIKSGFHLPPTNEEIPTPAPSPDVEDTAAKIDIFNSDIERSLVGLLLGDAE